MQNIANINARNYLAENIRRLLGGFSQSLLSRASTRSGVSKRTIASMISSSEANPTLDNITAVADALGVTISEILSQELGRRPRPAPTVEETAPTPYEITALQHSVSRLTVTDARLLLPIVTRLADAAESEHIPLPNSNNHPLTALRPQGKKTKTA